MINDKNLDEQIRNAMQDVRVPVGAKERLLLQLADSSEAYLSESSKPSNEFPPVGPETKHGFRYLLTKMLTPVASRSDWRNSSALWVCASVVLLLLSLVWYFQPSSDGDRIELMLAQQIELIENEPIRWQESLKIPKRLQPVLVQLIALQPLSVASWKSSDDQREIVVHALRNGDGKNVLIIEMDKFSTNGRWSEQLVPLDSNTGGWSCAIAKIDNRLVVLAVPGTREYMLRHLRTSTVT